MVANEKGIGRGGSGADCGDVRVERGIMRVLLVEDDHAIVRALTDGAGG